MHGLSEHDVFIFVLELGLIIFAARIFGLIAKKLGQPILVGEVFAGILLGPSVFGKFIPSWYEIVFPETGVHSTLLQGISWLCVLFLLLITGLEIDVRASLRHAKRSILTSLFGITIPFLFLYAIFTAYPFDARPNGVDTVLFNLIFALSLSVVAIPVVAKILFDLKILQSFVGLNVITSGVLCDIWGWAGLAVLISLISEGTVTVMTIFKPLFIIALYLGFALTYGRGFTDRILDRFNVKLEPATVLALLFSLALLNGAISHLLGLHVILGAFIAGLMAGESSRITPYMRQSIQDFIFGVFSPIFFVIIGMQLDLTKGMNWYYLIAILFLSSAIKIFGSFLGAFLGGIGKRNAFAVGCGLNTQGTMGIIIALIGVDLGIFDDKIFTFIVFICIATSLFVGPLLKWAIKGVERPLAKYFDSEHVFLNVEGTTKKEVIRNMARLMKEKELIEDASFIETSLWSREQEMSTAIGEGIALPHARIPNLDQPILSFFRLKQPVEFNSPDNKPVQLLFLELTDSNDHGMQLNLIAQVTRFLSLPKNRKKLIDLENAEDIQQVLTLDEKV